MKNKWAWFKRTLFGYTVVFANVERTYTLVHRPFREPMMKADNTPSGLRGKSFSIFYYDEVSEWPL